MSTEPARGPRANTHPVHPFFRSSSITQRQEGTLSKKQTKKQQSKIQHPSSRVANKQSAEDVYSTYLGVLLRVSYELAHHRFKYSADAAGEIAALVAEKFHRDGEANMAKYPTAEVFARVTTWHMAISFDRSERAQRCEGAHLVSEELSDGTVARRKGRSWVSGHAPILDGDGILYDTVAAAGSDVESQIVDADEAAFIVDFCFTGLSERQIDWVMQVDGYGHTVGEVAKSADFARETVQREISAARRIIKDNYERMGSAS